MQHDTACLGKRSVKTGEEVVPRVHRHEKTTQCQLQPEHESGAVSKRWLSRHMSFPLPQLPCGISEVLALDSFYYLVLINLLKPLCPGGGVSCEGGE